MTTELIVVRHGETDWNRGRRIQGHHQTELNSQGREQAQALATALMDERFAAVYSSDLLRARQTADVIAAQHGCAVLAEPRLREWDLGVLVGETRSSAQQNCPQALAIYRQAMPQRAIPGGESSAARHRRVIAAMEAIARAHQGGTVLVVAHGGPLDDCYRHACGVSLDAPRDFSLLNASINRFSVKLDTSAGALRWQLRSWGEVAHLAGMDVLGSSAGVAAALGTDADTAAS